MEIFAYTCHIDYHLVYNITFNMIVSDYHLVHNITFNMIVSFAVFFVPHD